MSRSRVPSFVAVAVAAAALATSAHARPEPPEYHVTLLDDMVEAVFPGVQYPSSDARALNENGDLGGEASLNGSQMQGFIYTVEHGVTPLPPVPGWSSSAVRDISDRDANGEIIIVGGGVPSVYVDLALGEAALWRFSTVTGTVLETRKLGIPAGFDDSIAVAVDNGGTVVGFSSLTGAFTNWKYDIATGVLMPFDFPWRVADFNNVGQVVGGVYRGDLLGNYEDLSDVYEPGEVMPDWAIENGGISAGWHRVNDLGWAVGRAGTGISDGAGHFLVAIVRFADPIGWTGMPPVSHLSLTGGINDQGDFTNRTGGVYLEDMGQLYALNALLAPEFFDVNVYRSNEINNNRQVAGSQAHVFLLTPLGVMIIPGDVNGDVSVDLDDYCAWIAAPVDLDGDGDADADDEQWLVDRLLVFGYTIEDCNGNGMSDHCDITSGRSLDCDENGVPDECQDDCNGDGVPDVCEPDCNGNGIPDPCDIAEGTSEDCNGNGIPDECDQGGVTEVTESFVPPINIPTEAFIVEDLLVVDPGIVDDVDFTIHVRYRIGDLTVLLSHEGTTITLIDRPGHPETFLGNGQSGYAPGVVDDEGTGGPIEDEGNFGSPFEPIVSPPSYTPNDPLSAFDGMSSDGIWTVTIITTNGFSPAHEFHGWGLTITRAAVEVPPCCDADLDGDGVTNVADLLIVLGAWGTPNGDATGDGTTNVADLLAVLAGWGPCV